MLSWVGYLDFTSWIGVDCVSKTLVGLVLTYFRDEFKKSVDTSDIDSALIARNKDPTQILRVLELVVGAVVMCERKDEFIGKIFDLSRAAQRVLKTIVEAFMHSLKDYTPENSPRTQPQELTKALGVVKHLRGERETLVKELNNFCICVLLCSLSVKVSYNVFFL